jgi:hypothetical protein
MKSTSILISLNVHPEVLDYRLTMFDLNAAESEIRPTFTIMMPMVN